jgi:MarR family transcriptional regulator, 2-MHQ and catechol-resistance regulon repressor
MSNNHATRFVVPASTVVVVGIADDDRLTAYGLFVEASRAVLAAVEDELDAAGLSAHEFEVLLRLLRTPGHRLRMTELAGCSGLSTSGMTRLIDRLERHGLVERKSCPTDRRGLEAGLTPSGRRSVETALRPHLDTIQRLVVDPLGGDLGALERPMRRLRDAAIERARVQDQ